MDSKDPIPYQLQDNEWAAWSLVAMGYWDGPRWEYRCTMTVTGVVRQRYVIRENRLFHPPRQWLLHKKRVLPPPRLKRLKERVAAAGFGVRSAPWFIHTDGADTWIVLRTKNGIHWERPMSCSEEETGPKPYADTLEILESSMPFRHSHFMKVSATLMKKWD